VTEAAATAARGRRHGAQRRARVARSRRSTKTPAADVAADARWRLRLSERGITDDVADYLRRRHLDQSWTVRAIGQEIGFRTSAVRSALDRHGIAYTPHARSRGAATERASELAARVGVADLDQHVRSRRADGWSWARIAQECQVSPSWLRRRTPDRTHSR
jgi:AraC-like DNA-binding protein